MRRVLKHPLTILLAVFVTGYAIGSADSFWTWAVLLLAFCGGFLATIWHDWQN